MEEQQLKTGVQMCIIIAVCLIMHCFVFSVEPTQTGRFSSVFECVVNIPLTIGSFPNIN